MMTGFSTEDVWPQCTVHAENASNVTNAQANHPIIKVGMTWILVVTGVGQQSFASLHIPAHERLQHDESSKR